MVGSAICRALQKHNEREAQAGLAPFYEVLTQDRQALDLTRTIKKLTHKI